MTPVLICFLAEGFSQTHAFKEYYEPDIESAFLTWLEKAKAEGADPTTAYWVKPKLLAGELVECTRYFEENHK